MDKDVHDRMLSVAEVCRDEMEALALSVTRFVAAGYMTSDVACWDAAYDAADGVIGPAEGAQLIARLDGRDARHPRRAWEPTGASCRPRAAASPRTSGA